MRVGISKRLDRLRRTIEGFTGFKSADTAIDDSNKGPGPVDHQQEMQFALDELRSLVLEAIDSESMQRSTYCDEIKPFSMDSTDSARDTGDLRGSSVESHFQSESVPIPLVPPTAQPLVSLA